MEGDNKESVMFKSNLHAEETANFEDTELIHEGSFADTFRARRGGKLFLLKAPHKGNNAFLHIIRREYELSVGLTHPNIASSISFEPDSPVGPCITMEYVDGVTLTDYLSRKGSNTERRRLLFQLLSAVEYLHTKGIVHNDLKPGNIIVSASGDRLKLIDFGLADDDAHFLTKSVGYTLDFASPELKAGEKTDARSDIFSLGRIISLMFPNRFKAITMRCCQTHPAKRFNNVSELRKSLAIRSRLPLISVISAVAVCAISAAAIAVNTMMTPAVPEIRDSVDPGYDALFQQALADIDEAVNGQEASACIAVFVGKFTQTRDSVLAILPESERSAFLSGSETTLDEMTSKLCLIEQALPTTP